MKQPNFLIIGAAKSGTTALHRYLGQHPEIFMPQKKEPKFFTFEGEEATIDGPIDTPGQKRYDDVRQGSICDRAHYHDLFTGVTDERAIGESSPLYLYCPRSAQRIYDYHPEMKLIAILRNPVDRAFSHYLQYSIQVQGDEYLPTFEKAIAAEPIKSTNIWNGLRHYVRMGFYYTQLKRYFDRFESHQLRVYFYEDLTNHPQRLLQDIFSFLQVDDTISIDTAQRHNVGAAPKNKLVHTSLGWINRLANTDNPALQTLKSAIPKPLYTGVSDTIKTIKKRNTAPKPAACLMETRKQLQELYQGDIKQLQDLVQRDLSHWLR